MTPKQKKSPGFEEAMAEVEAILARLEAGEIPIDDLSAEVKRAVGLVDDCRARLKKTELEVREFVRGLEDEDAADEAGDET